MSYVRTSGHPLDHSVAAYILLILLIPTSTSAAHVQIENRNLKATETKSINY